MTDSRHDVPEARPDAPHPEDDQKPDTPAKLEKRSWRYVLVKTVREFFADQCINAAAGLTYYAILSMFPALIAIFSLLGLFGQDGAAADAVLGILGDVAPADTVEALRGPIEQLSNAPGAGFAFVGGIVLALWSAGHVPLSGGLSFPLDDQLVAV